MMVKVKCPYCKEEAEIKYGVADYFCPYCGKRVRLLEDSTVNDVRTNVNFNVDVNNTTTRKIDEARIREAEVKESIELRKYELQTEQSKHSTILLISFFGIFAVIVFIVLMFA